MSFSIVGRANRRLCGVFFFFFNDTATTEIYTLSLHDALPILLCAAVGDAVAQVTGARPKLSTGGGTSDGRFIDRKSTRLNSSHSQISYAVFCLKKKKQSYTQPLTPDRCMSSS